MRNTNAHDTLFETTAVLTTLLAATAFAMLLRQLIAAVVPFLEVMFSQLTAGTGF